MLYLTLGSSSNYVIFVKQPCHEHRDALLRCTVKEGFIAQLLAVLLAKSLQLSVLKGLLELRLIFSKVTPFLEATCIEGRAINLEPFQFQYNLGQFWQINFSSRIPVVCWGFQTASKLDLFLCLILLVSPLFHSYQFQGPFLINILHPNLHLKKFRFFIWRTQIVI